MHVLVLLSFSRNLSSACHAVMQTNIILSHCSRSIQLEISFVNGQWLLALCVLDSNICFSSTVMHRVSEFGRCETHCVKHGCSSQLSVICNSQVSVICNSQVSVILNVLICKILYKIYWTELRRAQFCSVRFSKVPVKTCLTVLATFWAYLPVGQCPLRGGGLEPPPPPSRAENLFKDHGPEGITRRL